MNRHKKISNDTKLFSKDSTHLNDAKFIAVIILLGVIFRVFIAATLPFGVDENYTIAVGKIFALSYFDHPPLTFWLTGLIAKFFPESSELVYRLPSLLFGLATVFILFSLSNFLWGRVAAKYTALILSFAVVWSSFYGILILPDAALSFFSTGAIYFLVKALDNPEKLKYWIFGGGILAGAMLSKYQAAIIPIAVLLWALSNKQNRRIFRYKGPYLASLIGFVGCLPTIIWNYNNDFISFAFQSARAGGDLNLTNFMVMLIGQAIYVNPIVFVVIVYVVVSLIAKKQTSPYINLLLWLGLSQIIVFNLIYLFSSASLPHWPLLGWLFLVPIVGYYCSLHPPKKLFRYIFIGTSGVFIVLAILIAVHARSGIITNYLREESNLPPKWDNTVDVFDFKEVGNKLSATINIDNDTVFIFNNWINAGKLGSGLIRSCVKSEKILIADGNPHHFIFAANQEITENAVFLYPSVYRKKESEFTKLATEIAIKYNLTLQDLSSVDLNRGDLAYATVYIAKYRAR